MPIRTSDTLAGRRLRDGVRGEHRSVRPHLSYASAGHGPALLVGARAHLHLRPTGPLLGVLKNASFAQRREAFDSDALLVVVTDGFSECRNAVRLCRSAAKTVARCADIFTDGRYHDDATVAVIARRGRCYRITG